MQRAVRALPGDTLSHGDFHDLNLLYDDATSTLRVVDWETLSRRPRFFDLTRAWPYLADADDRARLLDRILAASPDLESLGLLHVYHSLLALHAFVRREGRYDGSLRGARSREALTALLAEARSRAAAWRH